MTGLFDTTDVTTAHGPTGSTTTPRVPTPEQED